MATLLDRTTAEEDLDLLVQLQCPRCGTPMPKACCNQCGFVLREQNGIWKGMPEERLAYYAQFTGDYERIRAAEGRGSATPDFYLNLPYRDASGRNQKQWAIRARTFRYLTRHLLRPSPRKRSPPCLGYRGWERMVELPIVSQWICACCG